MYLNPHTNSKFPSLYAQIKDGPGSFIIQREDGTLQEGLTPEQRKEMERIRDLQISELEQQIEQSSQDEIVN